MSFEKARACVQLLRPLNSLIMMGVIVSASILAGATGEWATEIAIAALAGGLIGGAANAINDYFDVVIDKINKPKRPLAREVISRKTALAIWFVLSLVGISLNLFLNFTALGIALLAVLLLFFYSAKLKGTVLLGNLTVAGMTGLAFVYGAVVLDKPGEALVPAIFAFLVNFAREIVKDVEDMEGDRRGDAMTFPLKYGVRPALMVASLSMVILIGATMWPYLSGVYSRTYFFLVLAVDLVLVATLVAIWKDFSPANLGKVSTALKATMVLGLAAIYFGS